MDILQELSLFFAPILKKEWPEAAFLPDLSETANPKFGDYQLNSAMKIAKSQNLSSRKVAERIVELTLSNPFYMHLIAKIEIAGPGFINLTLQTNWIEKRLLSMDKESHLGVTGSKKRERVLVEFSSPNVAKELHVGHLRSTIIGDCLARLFEFLGEDVLRINHVGDFGTQFGMLIAHLKDRYKEPFENETGLDIAFLLKAYKESKVRFDEDPLFKKIAQQEVVAFQREDSESLAYWKKIVALSRKSYQEIYDLLDVKLEERGESFYRNQIPGVISELEEKKLLEVSEGAKCLFIDEIKNREGQPMPLMVQKSDGGFGYDTTDLAAIRWRIFQDEADRIIYVTDLGQELHFKLIFEAAEKAGWLQERQVRLDHVGFGLVLGTDGKKLKTRSGETEKLIDLLTTAQNEARKILDSRNSDLTEKEKEEIALRLGLSAVKYTDLSSHRISDYTFSYEKMLRFEGNTAAFIFYSHVRAKSILKKLGEKKSALLEKRELVIEHESERVLALHLARFEETLHSMAEELLPNRLTDYLYRLAEKFNHFFRDCRVEGSKEEASRALLCQITEKVFAAGFTILGLFSVEKM